MREFYGRLYRYDEKKSSMEKIRLQDISSNLLFAGYADDSSTGCRKAG